MSRFFPLRPAESVTIVFLLVLLAVTMVFYKEIPDLQRVIFIYSALAIIQTALIHVSKKAARNGVIDFTARFIFPVVCVLIIFDSLERIVHYINPRDIDPLLIRLDYLIFNGYPTVMMESIYTPLVTDILQISYTSYYFLPISLGLILKLNGMEKEFDRMVFITLFCFYLSYVGYMLFPALGPRFTINHLQSSEMKGLLFAEPIHRLLNSIEGIKRDAFPSGHTAISLVVLGLAYRYQKAFFYVTMPIVVMLIISTVYCRYHYAVDVIGGVALAIAAYFIGERYYEHWEDRNNISH